MSKFPATTLDLADDIIRLNPNSLSDGDIAQLKRLALDQDCSVLMVTHDPRILDVGDRLLQIEDGRLIDENG